jgi:5-methylcytosine-specific restriction endonuclease McrA
MSDWFSSFTEAEDYERQATRTAVLLAKTRYDEQLKPFVKNSPERLSFVHGEIDRIADETAAEVGAMRDEVFRKLMAVVTSEVELPVTQPEHEDVEGGSESLPPEKFDKDKPEAQATTDVRDHGTVLEDEILKPQKVIPVQEGAEKHDALACVRCTQRTASEGSPVCTECETELIALASDDRPPLAKEADGTQVATPGQPQYATPVQQTPGMVPLNPNAPYQCQVCGFTGTFQAVHDHIVAAQDSKHLQFKQQQPGQQSPAGTSPVVQGQPMQTGAGVKTSQPMGAPPQGPPQGAPPGPPPAAQKPADDEPIKADEEDDNSPEGRFHNIIDTMANRAAVRHFSEVDDDTVHQIASQYGIDDAEVRKRVVTVANFGDFSATNGKVGDGNIPDGYSEVDGLGGPIDDHEAVVPTRVAVRETAKDLGTDEETIYRDIKDTMGDDLSDEYHTSVTGEQHFYLPDELVGGATANEDVSNQEEGPDQEEVARQANLVKDLRIQLARVARRLDQAEASVQSSEEV